MPRLMLLWVAGHRPEGRHPRHGQAWLGKASGKRGPQAYTSIGRGGERRPQSQHSRPKAWAAKEPQREQKNFA